MTENCRSRVQLWLESYNPDEQSYSGLYVDSDCNQFEPIYNLYVSWGSNINLVHNRSHNLDNNQEFMHKSNLIINAAIMILFLFVTWRIYGILRLIISHEMMNLN